MSGARIKISGLTESLRLTEGVSKRLRDMGPALRPAAEEFKALTDDSFEKQSAPNGKGWASLKASTLARRRGQNGRILVDTGRLRNSLTAIASKTAIRVGQVSGGSLPKYAIMHQFGDSSKQLPARPFLPFDEAGSLMSGIRVKSSLARIERYVSTYVLEGRVRP